MPKAFQPSGLGVSGSYANVTLLRLLCLETSCRSAVRESERFMNMSLSYLVCFLAVLLNADKEERSGMLRRCTSP